MRAPRQRDYGWTILAVAVLIAFVGSGARFSFSLMLKPMQQEFVWSRSTISLVQTLTMVVSAGGMLAVGRFIDRYSLRLALAGGAVLASVGLASLGVTHSKWQFFFLYGVVFAVGSSAAFGLSVSVLISRWFTKRRGLANSMGNAGGALGQLIVIGVLSSFLVTLGWRNAYRILGISIGALAPIMLLFVRSWPPSRGAPAPAEQRVGGGDPAGQAMTSTAVSGPTSIRPILGSRSYLQLLLIWSICGFQDFFVATHVVAFATDQGIGTVLAGNLLALMGVMGMVGVLMSGVMADAFGPMQPTRVCFLLRILIFLLVMVTQSTAAVIIFALAYGFTFLITAPLSPVFVGRLFGLRRMGTLTAGISMSHQLAAGLGAFVGGAVFDQFGSYYWAFVLAFALSLVATAATFVFREAPVSGAVASPDQPAQTQPHVH
ncbi:MAG: MFS transporter [Chloroflexi bacterium]|nr:MFS transporter [Chloroflexota bacterium]